MATSSPFAIGVPALKVRSVEVGMSGSIAIRSLPQGRLLPATISEISPDVAPNGTYEVTLAFTDALEDALGLRAGMDGECVLRFPNPLGAAMRIPATCVVGRTENVSMATEEKAYVWVVDQLAGAGPNAVEKRLVTVGALSGNGEIEIHGGLEPGEWVVSKGVHALDEGMMVQVIPPAISSSK